MFGPNVVGESTLVFERQMQYRPEKIWRVLTQPHLIEEWLMKSNFAAEVGHKFTFRGTPLPGWSGITNCEVVIVEAPCRLAYRWGDGTESASGLITIVTWTLIPQDGGTLVRMEQSGFRPEDGLSHDRMAGMWLRVLERMEQVAGGDE